MYIYTRTHNCTKKYKPVDMGFGRQQSIQIKSMCTVHTTDKDKRHRARMAVTQTKMINFWSYVKSKTKPIKKILMDVIKPIIQRQIRRLQRGCKRQNDKRRSTEDEKCTGSLQTKKKIVRYQNCWLFENILADYQYGAKSLRIKPLNGENLKADADNK